MILLDTNVLSELMRAAPAPRVVDWIAAQIAVIARCSGAAIGTRNVADFEGCGVEVLNP